MARRSRGGQRRAASGPARARRRRPAPEQSQPTAELAESSIETAALAPAPVEHEPAVPESPPEREFAARPLPPEPERPLPSTRRAIFFDVENTSRASHVARLIDHLAVDRLGVRTEFVAVGNWRVIGHDTARLLARHGAHLVHAAPSTGVKDWSDLRIAVAAGVWLGTARPGDVLEIVSDDRAFDAVGDVAANLGIAYRRLSYRSLSGAPEPEPVEAAAPVYESDGGHRRRRGRRRGGRGRGPAPHAPAPHAPVPHAPAPHAPPPRRMEPVHTPAAADEPHTAPHDEIISVVRDLIHAAPDRSTTLDSLANTLKARGFSRPPGSPRLITRLRRIKEVAVSRSGVITLTDAASTEGSPMQPAALGEDEAQVMSAEAPRGAETTDGAPQAPPDQPRRRRRRSRRGGRGRRRGRGEPAATV